MLCSTLCNALYEYIHSAILKIQSPRNSYQLVPPLFTPPAAVKNTSTVFPDYSRLFPHNGHLPTILSELN